MSSKSPIYHISRDVEAEFGNQVDKCMRVYNLYNVLLHADHREGQYVTQWTTSAREASMSWHGVCA